MQVSAEARWFWRAVAPPGLEDWFCRASKLGCAAGGGNVRADEYLCDDCQSELGIKRRGKKKDVELKGLVSVRANVLESAPFLGPSEIWVKWTTEALDLSASHLILVEKQRWLRKFDTSESFAREIALGPGEQPLDDQPLPVLSCNVELTKVRLPASGNIWWTFGFEAFGTIETVDGSLCSTAVALAGREPPELAGGYFASYPAWLKEHALS
jgi:hypothetical protein